MYVSGVLQAAALDVVTQPGVADAPARPPRTSCRPAGTCWSAACGEHAPQAHVEHVPTGGLNLWARLPDGTDVDRLARDCEAAGVIIAAGTEWFPAEPAGPYIRLNYAGPNPGAFPEGARILGQVLDRTAGR